MKASTVLNAYQKASDRRRHLEIVHGFVVVELPEWGKLVRHEAKLFVALKGLLEDVTTLRGD